MSDKDNRLPSGSTFKSFFGRTITVEKYLAEGGQGEVYVVDMNGEKKALKWYKPGGMGKDPHAFYDNIKHNVMRGAPSSEFLWPIDITEWKDGTFGYLMDLRPSDYYEISEFTLCNVRFTSLKTIVDSALRIVSAFRILHNAGYSYQDLNDGNFFINPKTGAVLICDNDNVAPDGTFTGIVGKPGYIAPEIIKGSIADDPSKRKMPDTYSDRFSMSIIIFMLFCLTRPLEGKRTLGNAARTESLMRKVYGTDPHFIMEDIAHPKYGPDQNLQKNAFALWGFLPQYMKDFFLNAFSQRSISNPTTRPPEIKWLQVLTRFRSEILKCQCGAELLSENGSPTSCAKCKRKYSLPVRIYIKDNDYSIPGAIGSRIYKCQLGACNTDEALFPIGHVVYNPDTQQLRLKNLTDKHWYAESPSGKVKNVLPKASVPLLAGIRINIDSKQILFEQN